MAAVRDDDPVIEVEEEFSGEGIDVFDGEVFVDNVAERWLVWSGSNERR